MNQDQRGKNERGGRHIYIYIYTHDFRVAMQNLQTNKLVLVVREKQCSVNWLPLTMHLKS